LLQNLFISRDETVVLDMEAGFEHLTRGTAKAFDAMIIVVEPGMRSIRTAEKIAGLAEKSDVRNVFAVGNKVEGEEDREYIKDRLGDITIVGFISASKEIARADREGKSPYDLSSTLVSEVKEIRDALAEFLQTSQS
jgi:CO dehydrogenase maturation factor